MSKHNNSHITCSEKAFKKVKQKINRVNLTNIQSYKLLKTNGVIASLEQRQKVEISPKWTDLAKIYIQVRERKPFSILEFGSGFSTVVMACALKQNWQEYLKITKGQPKYEKPSITSIESSKKWKLNSELKIKKAGLSSFARIVFSGVRISEHQGQVCHFYEKLPNVVPDFVYLDGPDPADVTGSINGISFNNPKRTVMAGDILKYESTLLPGFFMMVDGRTNNARFLMRMLKRSYRVMVSEELDITTFELAEKRLGRKNIYGFEAYLSKKRFSNKL